MSTVVATAAGIRHGAAWLFQNVELTALPGVCVALTGTNGSGKSTLLRCLYGAEVLSAGSVLVGGAVPDERSAAFRRAVSVVLDDSDTFEELTAVQHLELLAGEFGGAFDVAEVLARVGLAERHDVPAAALSAGQRRRLLLAGATARPHEVLLLDEPERALDAAGRRWLAALVDDAKRRAAVVFATHDRSLVESVADVEVRL